MTPHPPARAPFVDRVGSLDRAALTALVAALYEARGLRTEDLGAGRLAADDGGSRRTLLVARAVPAAPPDDDVDVDVDVVVVGTVTDRDRAGDARVLDAADLHRMALYAVDRERLAPLVADHLGRDLLDDRPGPGGRLRAAAARARSAASRVGRVPPRLRRVASGRRSTVSRAASAAAAAARSAPRGVAAALVLVALAGVALSALGPVGPSVTGGPPGAGTPTVTPAPVAAAAVGGTLGAVPDGCPAPPRDAAPRTLRPVPVDAAVSVGLEGWSVDEGIDVSTFDGPNELEVGAFPEIRHKSTYGRPTGSSLVLIADRWPDVATARETAPALAAEYRTAVAWGRYTLTVAAPGATDGVRTDADVRALLEAVRAPGGVRLGGRCLTALSG